MDVWTSIGIAAVLEVLKSRKDWRRNATKLAKLYVKLDQLVQVEPELRAEVEAQRSRG